MRLEPQHWEIMGNGPPGDAVIYDGHITEMGYMYLIYLWVNYKGNHPKMVELFRLVKYYNLPRERERERYIYIYSGTYVDRIH